MNWKKICFGLVFVVMALFTFLIWQRHTIKDYKDKPYYFEYNDTTIQNVVRTDTVWPAPITLVNTVYRDTLLYDTLFYKVDTLAILTDYYAERTYKDVLIDNDTLTFEIEEKVFKNALAHREFNYSLTIPERTITRTVVESHRGLYFNSSVMVSKTDLGVNGSLLLIDKKNRLFGLGVGYFHDPFVSGSFGFSF